jgi:hypothetical protein
MSGYEAFYDRAHAAAKKKSKDQPATPPAENAPKPAERKEEDPRSKGYIELDLSGLRDKLYDGYERAVIGRKFDYAVAKTQGVLALPRLYAMVGYVGIILILFILVGIAVVQKGIEIPMLLFFLVFIALGAALVLIGKYEIHYDENGFSTRLGKKVLRQYAWSEVTGIANYTTVYVNGKKLFVDHTVEGFGFFYEYAKRACKGGKGKPTPPSEKKQKSRKNTGK